MWRNVPVAISIWFWYDMKCFYFPKSIKAEKRESKQNILNNFPLNLRRTRMIINNCLKCNRRIKVIAAMLLKNIIFGVNMFYWSVCAPSHDLLVCVSLRSQFVSPSIILAGYIPWCWIGIDKWRDFTSLWDLNQATSFILTVNYI